MRAIAVALLFAPLALRGEIPSAWPDAPEGLVIRLSNPLRYDAGAATTADGTLFAAWCDASDGTGAVRVQALSADGQPLWDADGIALPARQGTAFAAQVASDGAGGALVVWQAVADVIGGSSLFVQRVTSLGPQWAEPALLSENCDLFREGSLADGDRTAVLTDRYKSAVGDGTGGLWVLWRERGAGLRLQHVGADGSLDDDFPATGLELVGTFWSLDADGAGGVWIAATGDDRLRLRGVSADGALFPSDDWFEAGEPGWEASDASIAAGAGGPSAFWLESSAAGAHRARLQRWSAELQPQLPDSALFDFGAWPQGLALRRSGDEHLLAWRSDSRIRLQRVDGAGLPRWAEPLALTQPDHGCDLLGLEILDEDALALVWEGMEHEHATHRSLLLRVSPDGAPAWPQPLEFTGELRDHSTRLLVDGASARVLWSEQSDLQRVRSVRVDGDGQLPWPAGAGLLAEAAGEEGFVASLVETDEWLWLLVSLGDSLEVVRHERATGDRLPWPGGPVRLPRWADRAVADGAGGVWFGRESSSWGEPRIQVWHVDSGGAVIGPLLPFPQDAAESRGLSLRARDGALAIASVPLPWAESDEAIRFQWVEPDGALRWGETGAELHPPLGGEARPVLSAWSVDDAGGVEAVWIDDFQGDLGLAWFQALDGNGERLHGGALGRGLAFEGVWERTINDSASTLTRQEDGARGVLLRRDWTIHWLRVDAAALPVAPLQLSAPTATCVGGVLAARAGGGARIAWVENQDGSLRMRRVLFDAGGDPDAIWLRELPEGPYGLVGGRADALVLAGSVVYSAHVHLRGFGAQEPEGEPQELWTGRIGASPHVSRLDTGPVADDGTLALVWQDDRCGLAGYGFQSRLQVVRVFDPPVAVHDPAPAARPQALRLVGAAPNPFNPSTWITFELGTPSPVTLEVFDILGRRVRAIDAGLRPAGEHRLLFDGSDPRGELASGVYVYRLRAGGESATGRLLLLR